MKAVILGGGESGFGSAVLAKSKGMETFVSDSGTIAPKYAERLSQLGIRFEQGGHTQEALIDADVVIKSPGIPEKAPIVKFLRSHGVKIVSEIEFARPFSRGRTICITGSNGKTTTTTLAYKILSDAHYDVAVGGNIGQSYAYTVATADREWYVLEISSFQLDGCYDFRADTAVLMNITPDHLDRYNYLFDNYIKSKMRIVRNQTAEQSMVYCADDEVIAGQIAELQPQTTLVPFSKSMINADGTFTVSFGQRRLTVDSNKMKINGLHNIYDTMAAVLAAMSAEVDDQTILSSVYSFEGVEHRLEKVATVDGVEYINDSKATNVDSVRYALGSMTRPTVWIAGGTDKGNDYDLLKDLVFKHVKALVCMGLNNEKLIDNFRGLVPVYNTNSLDEAIRVCHDVSVAGDTVLLSPACASFDLFSNYEDRGRQFKERVARLKEQSTSNTKNG